MTLFDVKPAAVVYDDHQLFAEMFSSWLSKTGFFRYVYSFHTEEELIRFFFSKGVKSIYLFCDYYIGETNATQTIYDIRRICPSVKLVVVTSCVQPVLINTILEISPHGLLSKVTGLDEVALCLRSIEDKKRFISPYMQGILATQKDKIFNQPFTTRELELLNLFAKGYSVIKTAEFLNISKHTIIAHRQNMMKKADCNTIVELLAFARTLKIITD